MPVTPVKSSRSLSPKRSKGTGRFQTVRAVRPGRLGEPGTRCNGPRLWPSTLEVPDVPDGTCSIDDCVNPSYCRTWCRRHYRRWERTGSPEFTGVVRTMRNSAEDFWKRVDRREPDECWEWKLHRGRHGYGRGSIEGRQALAHRIAYELAIGPIPEGLVLDHLCRNPPCCNPAHLEPVTSAENTRRGDHTNCGAWQREKTHCVQGHAYDEANTYRRPNGTRMCRECARLADLARWPVRKQQRRDRKKAS